MELAGTDRPPPERPFALGDTVTFDAHPTWHRDDLVVIGTVCVVGRHTVEVRALPGSGRLIRIGGLYYPWPDDVRPAEPPAAEQQSAAPS